MRILGIDTSNYTTSAALYDSECAEVLQRKKLLPVKSGEKGLRQSDAVFHHTVQLWELVEELFAVSPGAVDAVGVSVKPRNADGSYMPCFSVGVNAAHCIAAASGVPVYGFSHQCGHIAAALYSCGKFEELHKSEFIAFHVSGGTTEMLLVTPDDCDGFNAEIIGKTLDLNAGQAVDRAGVLMGLPFPCGAHLEKLALQSDKKYRPKVYFKDGCCSLSGVENQCKRMLDSGENQCDIARFCIDCITVALDKMTAFALEKYGKLPLLYAGGVVSDSIIRNELVKKYSGFFAAPEFSCDNAAGTALLAYERRKKQ